MKLSPIIILLLLFALSAKAELPLAIQNTFKKDYPKIQIRLDDLPQLGDKLWLPFVTSPKIQSSTNGTEAVNLVLRTADEDYLFSNGWIYTPIKNNTVKSLDEYDPLIQKQILLNQIIQSFIVPKKFTLPRDLALTTGRLPIEFRDVELATSKQIEFKKRLKEQEALANIKLLSYSNISGKLNLIELTNNGKVLSSKVPQEAKLSYIANIKSTSNKIYFADYNQGKIYQCKRPKSTDKNPEIKLEELISLADYEIKAGLKDIAIDEQAEIIYLLNNIEPKLLVINLKDKKLIRTLDVPFGSSNLNMISRNSTEADQLFFLSRANSKLVTMSTLNYSVTNEAELKSVPYSLALSPVLIFVGLENKILVLDAVSFEKIETIDLEYTPYKLVANSDTVYALGFNSDGSFISKIKFGLNEKISEINIKLEKTISLNPDIIDPKELSLSNSGSMIFVPSSSTNTIGVIDAESFELVQKLSTEDRASILVNL